MFRCGGWGMWTTAAMWVGGVTRSTNLRCSTSVPPSLAMCKQQTATVSSYTYQVSVKQLDYHKLAVVQNGEVKLCIQ